MPTLDAEKRRLELLDKLSAMLEAVGFPHPVSHVYAALTLAEDEGLSTNELVDQLGISKASISNAMRFLVGTELVERYRVRGSRQAYYRVLKGKWGDLLTRKFAAMSYIAKTAEEALASAQSPKARERLEEMYDVYSYFEKEFADLVVRFKERTER